MRLMSGKPIHLYSESSSGAYCYIEYVPAGDYESDEYHYVVAYHENREKYSNSAVRYNFADLDDAWLFAKLLLANYDKTQAKQEE